MPDQTLLEEEGKGVGPSDQGIPSLSLGQTHGGRVTWSGYPSPPHPSAKTSDQDTPSPTQAGPGQDVPFPETGPGLYIPSPPGRTWTGCTLYPPST